MASTWKEPKELKIPVSYGHIAAKVWGDDLGEPVLAIHGWLDNAGTFDKLIPLLTPNLKVVAIDTPGHGLSSHKPIGTFNHYMEILVDIKRVIDYLKLGKFSFLGHSMGGILALLYTSVFPEAVKNIILLDIIKPLSRSPEYLPNVTRAGVLALLNLEEKMSSSAPVYTMEEARSRLIKATFNELTPESADILLKRGTIPSRCGKGVIFSRDIRYQTTEELQKFSHDDLKAFMKRIKSNMLILTAINSFVYKSRKPEILKDFIDIYKENCQTFKEIKVEGNHFMHLNNPEQVAPHINDFFREHLKQNLSKL